MNNTSHIPKIAKANHMHIMQKKITIIQLYAYLISNSELYCNDANILQNLEKMLKNEILETHTTQTNFSNKYNKYLL